MNNSNNGIDLAQGAGVLEDEALLCYYAQQWSHYKAGIQRLDHVFKRFNELFVKRKRAEGLRDIYEVNTVRVNGTVPRSSLLMRKTARSHTVAARIRSNHS